MNAATEFAWTHQPPKRELSFQFENAPVGLAQCQRQGNITALNPALEQMLARRASASRPLFLADLIHPEDPGEGKRLLRELFDGSRDSFQIDSSPTDAERQSDRWTVWRVQGTSGEPDYALALFESVRPGQLTRDRDAELRLRQAEKLEAVGRLAGGVAHDFNNLLTGVLLYCDLLLANLEPCHRVRKYAQEIRSAGLQATGLVRQLLAVARPTNSEPRLLSLNEIADGMRNLLVRLIGENIQLEFHLDPNLGLVKMDPTQVQQILLNLVLNARDAMPSGGAITVETRNGKVQVLAESGSVSAALLPCALFVVGDTGSGMDAATQAHLFEAFFTTKSGGKGTGLGLATVHDIVTSNGGLIHVDSAPARGTRVTVLLPLVPEAATNSLQVKKCTKSEGAFPAIEKEQNV